ncbi:glycosyltransferase family 4 protein [Bifidobacterium vansinderenii]|uniref:Glycosyltransferase, group 1 family protein n=1 Tax=Bifidobacterium vansinderenii TaxID=1984871 RepID=A0A229W009_9BIFI|nr:glycosyltransferase family 4 protein [Bifidobacterium vansinderenii]OXN01191.1 glycosyltransferase, group 1 family protein [Bifidobacterium vansinderenii]
MKKICLVAPGLLPVPATQGGAIETLMTSLIEENEKHHLIDLTVVAPHDDRSRTQADAFRHTRFIMIPSASPLIKAKHRLMNAIVRRVSTSTRRSPSAFYDQVLHAIRHEDFVVMYCGRIMREKGILELLQAIEMINDPHVKLMIIGSSNFGPSERTPYVDKVTALADRLGERVAYTGYVPNDRLYRYSKIADMQVVPSVWEEAAGLVGVEAMAAGFPLVVTCSGGIQEYVSSDCAITVDRDDHLISGLDQAITDLLNDPDKRASLSDAGAQRAPLFDTKSMYHRFVEACERQ